MASHKLADKKQISCNPRLGDEISLGGDKYVTIQSPVIAASSASMLKSTELQVSLAQVGNGYPIKPGLHLQQGWKGLRGQGAEPLESTPEGENSTGKCLDRSLASDSLGPPLLSDHF